MDFSSILGLVSVLLTGGALGFIFRFMIDRRKLGSEEKAAAHQQRKDDFEMLMAVVTNQRDEAYAKIKDYDRKIENLELEIQGLRMCGELDPFPNWIINLDGQYVFINREFEKRFLEPKGWNYRDVIGAKHEKLWSDEICRKLKALDDQARARPDGRARATIEVDGLQLTVHKFPIRVRGIPVAFAGYITDIEPLNQQGARVINEPRRR